MLEIRQSGNFDTFLRHRAFKFYNTMKQMQNDTEHLFQKDQHDEAEGRGCKLNQVLDAIHNYEVMMAEMKSLRTV